MASSVSEQDEPKPATGQEMVREKNSSWSGKSRGG